ncbi:hypothetical protein ACIGEP_05660 [Microbacterium sp. NPDC077663]|uniref:hypothetical protein n=1 Tax=Microbacterium sp. NPDC077663 TaxID=3364189 RepID=UPI0037CA8151
MPTGDLFPTAYLAEIINERDATRRSAAIERLIHPDICHVSFDRAVYGRVAFEHRVDAMVAVMTPSTHASLRGTPRIDGDSVFFQWQLSDGDDHSIATGGAFVVLTAGLATWFYATLNLEGPPDA